jgi:hypothetical protein
MKTSEWNRKLCSIFGDLVMAKSAPMSATCYHTFYHWLWGVSTLNEQKILRIPLPPFLETPSTDDKS